ncbi:FRG domain-containing protein [Solidesulfovibrio sp.]|uniref:FRG domain-containing protein n=1 Tax=Solidesulfovibrio sp. TaxID=2910990 RepID=UPI0026077B0D|nr:FRG domain-containing protein [Solidesulfovibrio sp.]
MINISNNTEITSLSQLLEVVFHRYKKKWYRGESSDFGELKLIPSIFRQQKYNEKFLFHSFKCRHYEKYYHYNDFQWLCLMQHYDLPTRLLDWTTNPLISLYFATQLTKQDGFIYIMDPADLNLRSESKGRGLYLSSNPLVEIRVAMIHTDKNRDELYRSKTFNLYPSFKKEELKKHLFKYFDYSIAISPEIMNSRMLAQSCCFTISGGIATKLSKHLSIGDIANIEVIKIPYSAKKNIRNQLDQLSIHQGTLFPEIEYTSKHLKELLAE